MATQRAEERELRQRTMGRLLKEARIKAGLMQSDVARRLGYTSAQFISNWERGISLPPMDQLPKLIALLKIPSRLLVERMHRYQVDQAKIQRRRLTLLLRTHAMPRS